MASTSWPVFQALVQTVRANGSLYASLKGGIHEGFAAEKIIYPMAVYTPVTMPYEDQWGARTIITVVDISIISRSQVEASNLDQSMSETLDGASLTPTGQTSLICRRIADLRLAPDVDEEGQKVYGVGGSYEIWTDQSL
jgi:hypothetical protein